MNIAIIGYATEGKISAEYFARQGHDITVCDQNDGLEVPAEYQTQLGEAYLTDLDRFDVIVRSAGIAPHIILADNPDVAPKITTAVDEFFAHCPTKNTIGITGTKGKGTTSTLTAKMLEAAGHTVWLGGNIGRSPLEFIDEIKPEDWVVIELSSFQLIDIGHAPHIATCIMVVPEHLNWHADLDEYLAAKARLFAWQEPTDVAIYFAGSEFSKAIATSGPAEHVAYFEAPMARVESGKIMVESTEVCQTNEIQLLGSFNWQNVCAALTIVWQAGIRDVAAMRSVITTFAGLEHHLEFVRELDGVKYYDDSFGTIPETAIVALEAFAEPKVVILGGSDKGATYDELARAVTRTNVRHAVLIGDQAARIQAALDAAGFAEYSNGGSTMTEIVATCRSAAKPGDIVLLSTGCASFGLFTDYKDRGNKFKDAVQALA